MTPGTMRKQNLTIIAIVVTAALAFYAWRERSTLPPGENLTQVEASAQAAPVTPKSAADTSTPMGAPPARPVTRPTTESFANMYAKAENNLEFIRRIYADAQKGDAEAQFQLYSALKYCERYYAFYFVRGDYRKTLDEALGWAATRSPATSAEEAREVHRRCQELMENHANEFGRADAWLVSAAESGHSEAQLARAEQLVIASLFPPDEEVNAAEQDGDQDRLVEAKDLLLQGLKRRDPSAVWKVGELHKVLVGDHENTDRDAWVWRLTACKMGYDCSQTADWYQFMCRSDYNCQPHESGVDFILRATADTHPDVDFLSDELVERINEGDPSVVGWR